MLGTSNGRSRLKILIRKSQGITILDLRGKSTLGNSGSEILSAELRRLSDNGVNNLLLNVEELTQVDSSSIGALVRAYVALRGKGGNLKLLRPRDRVKMVLNVFHLLDRIPNFEDESQALASFGLPTLARC